MDDLPVATLIVLAVLLAVSAGIAFATRDLLRRPTGGEGEATIEEHGKRKRDRRLFTATLPILLAPAAIIGFATPGPLAAVAIVLGFTLLWLASLVLLAKLTRGS